MHPLRSLVVLAAVALLPACSVKQEAPAAKQSQAPQASAAQEAPNQVAAEGPAEAAAPTPKEEAAMPAEKRDESRPQVVIETTMGTMKIELRPDVAPETVKNFLQYVKDSFYDGLIFHRVVAGFVIQGGGYSPDLMEKPTRAPLKNEAATALSNRRGTIAMARTQERHSATSQFYINLRDNPMLDYSGEYPTGFGYCAFGEVLEGLDVVDAIGGTPTGRKPPFPGNEVPVQPVIITRAYLVEAQADKAAE
jgi:cyclophilin family peptidyl-prolyl cis-trans isomerase